MSRAMPPFPIRFHGVVLR